MMVTATPITSHNVYFSLSRKGRNIDPRSFKKLRISSGFSQKSIAILLGVKERTVRNWEYGIHRIPRAAYSVLAAASLAIDRGEVEPPREETDEREKRSLGLRARSSVSSRRLDKRPRGRVEFESALPAAGEDFIPPAVASELAGVHTAVSGSRGRCTATLVDAKSPHSTVGDRGQPMAETSPPSLTHKLRSEEAKHPQEGAA